MTHVVREYPLSLASGSDIQTAAMPVDSRILGVITDGSVPILLMLVDPDGVDVDRNVTVVVSEQTVRFARRRKYAGSVFIGSGDIAYHVFVGRYTNDPRGPD